MRMLCLCLPALFLLSSIPAANAGIPYDRGHLSLERDVVYGGEDSPENEALVFPSRFVVDEQGNVYVSEYKLHCIMVYAAAGALTRTIGADGEGPGDFRSPSALVREDDGNLVAYDFADHRIQRVTPEGGFVGEATVMFPDQIRTIDCASDGTLFATLFVGSIGPPKGPQTMALVRLDEDLAVAARVDSMTVRTTIWAGTDNGYSMTMAPFYPTLEWAPLPGGGLVVGKGTSPELRIIDTTGATETTFALSGEAAPVTRADRDRFMDRFMKNGKLTIDAALEEAITFPDRMPWLFDILVDGDGHILVRRDRGEGEEASFDVFDRVGRPLGHFTTDPLPPRVAFYGDAIYALYLPGEELPSIVRWVVSGESERGETDAP